MVGALLTVTVLLRSVEAIGSICSQIVHGNFYDLGSLKSESGYSLDISNAKGKILFNMCQFLSFRCPGYNDSIAVYRTDETCVPLTNSSLAIGYNASILEKPNQTDNLAGINFTFPGVVSMNPTLGNQGSKYNLHLFLSCDPNITDSYVWDDPLPTFNSANGTITVYGRGAASCPKVSGTFIVEFFDKFSYVTAVIAIIIGLVQCFYGYRLYRPTVFLLGFLLAFMVIVLFLFGIWTGPDSPSYKGYVIVGFAVITGILFGFLVAAVAWVAIVVSGAILGFFLSTFLYTLALYKIASKPDNLLFYNTLAIGMVLGSIGGYEFQSAILILSCSFTGSYLIVRGVSVFIGGFPSELNLSTNSQAGIEETSSVYYYVYLAAILVLTAAGIFAQKRLHSSDFQEEQNHRLLWNLLHKDDKMVEMDEVSPGHGAPPGKPLPSPGKNPVTDNDQPESEALPEETESPPEVIPPKVETKPTKLTKSAAPQKKKEEKVAPPPPAEPEDESGEEESEQQEDPKTAKVVLPSKVAAKVEVAAKAQPKKQPTKVEVVSEESPEEEEPPKPKVVTPKVAKPEPEKSLATKKPEVMRPIVKAAEVIPPKHESGEEEEQEGSEEPQPPPVVVKQVKKKAEEIKVPESHTNPKKKVIKKEIEETEEIEEPPQVEIKPKKAEKVITGQQPTEESDNVALNPIKKKIKKALQKLPEAADEPSNLKKAKKEAQLEEEVAEIPVKKVKAKKKAAVKTAIEEED
jgi:hypothetical protein